MKNLALHILDISENSIRAGASCIHITLNESIIQNTYSISIEDNGKGMPSELLEKVTDPFTTTRSTRKVGLGLSLLKQHSEICGGSFSIRSEPGCGCNVFASFMNDHIDKPPSGDLPGILRILVSANHSIRFIYSHFTDFGQFEFDTEKLKNELGEKEFFYPLIQKYMKAMIFENLIGINAI